MPEAIVEEYLARNLRPTLFTRFLRRRTGEPLASRFWGVSALPRGTAWPTMPDGAPMRFVGQFNFVQAGHRPEAIPRVGFLALFVTPTEDGMVMCDDPVVVITAGSPGDCAEDGAHARAARRNGEDRGRVSAIAQSSPSSSNSAQTLALLALA